MEPRHPPILEAGRRRHSHAAIVLLLLALGLALAIAALLLLPSSSSRKPSPPTSQGKVRARPNPGHASQPMTSSSRYQVALSGAKNIVKPRFGNPPHAGLLFNVDTGKVLWRRRPHERLPIASLTKMMTALIAVERANPHERVLITKEVKSFVGSGVGVLPKGKRVQLEALLNGLMLPSGNDAAIALAQYLGGSVRGFVRMMNKRARELGLRCTHFNTPHGFKDRGNYSCAADLATLARADLAQPRIRRIARRRQAAIPFPIKNGRLFLYNNNPLIRLRYRGATGLKTGYTGTAGRCIVATAKRGRRHLGVVLIHSPDTYGQAVRLLNAGFRAYPSRDGDR